MKRSETPNAAASSFTSKGRAGRSEILSVVVPELLWAIDVILLMFQSELFADEVWVDSDAGVANPFVYHAAREKIHEGLDFGVGPIAEDLSSFRRHDRSIDDAAGGDQFFKIEDSSFDDGDEERASVRVVESVT
jgi:hypothetical protein